MTDEELALHRRIAELEERVKNVRITGDDQLDVQGSFATGFSFNVAEPPVSVAPPPTICEGDFEGDAVVAPEDFIEIVSSIPYGITVQWVELSSSVARSMNVDWYNSGAGAEAILFDEDTINPPPPAGNGIRYEVIGTDVIRFHANPTVAILPGGNLALNGSNQIVGGEGEVSSTIHYKIHYTYNCADAP